MYDNQFIASSNLSFTATGLVNGDTIDSLLRDSGIYSCLERLPIQMGTYSITLSGLSHDSYNIVYVGGNTNYYPSNAYHYGKYAE